MLHVCLRLANASQTICSFFSQEYIYFYCLFAVILCIIPHSIHSIA